jgi:hypothetical protein
MRKIIIVGSGQCGLQIGLALLQDGYDVTVVTNRTAADVRSGKVLSSQCMFDTALQHERDMRLNFWEAECPQVSGVEYNVAGPAGGRPVHWSARLDAYAQSVDQRVKIPGWMDLFEQRGGRLLIEDAGIAELERHAGDSELVLVASGKGEIARIFERDAARSPFDKPMRALALTYVHNLEPRPGFSAVCFNVIPGIGEYFVFPALTISGPCEIMVYEGVIGGPMDECWRDARTASDHIAASKWILDTWLPWEAARCRNIELTDDNGRLIGRFPPAVRNPVATLPSGRRVMGIADAVVLNDPLTGQGSNNASKCARVVYDAIIAQGDKPFDATWMQQTFDRYWDYAQWPTKWTSALLVPPEEPIPTVIAAAMDHPAFAREISNAFDDPRKFEPWLYDRDAAASKLAEYATAAARLASDAR